MAAGDWYYQVWVHYGQESRVQVVETYKEQYRARKEADVLNAIEKRDSLSDRPPRRFFFVQPVTEEQLREAAAERFRRHLSEDRKRFMQQYHGELQTLTKEIAASMLYAIDSCEMEKRVMLHNNGGWLEGFRRQVSGMGTITCSVLYSSVGRVSIEVAIIRGKQTDATMVELFSNERLLKSWLLNGVAVSAACENRLIDLLCDRYRINMQLEDPK